MDQIRRQQVLAKKTRGRRALRDINCLEELVLRRMHTMFYGYLETQSRIFRSLLLKLPQNSGIRMGYIRMRYIEDDNDFIDFVNGALSRYHPEN